MFLSLGYQGKGKSQSGLMMVLQALIFMTHQHCITGKFIMKLLIVLLTVNMRFDQPGYRVYLQSTTYDEELDFICEFYKDDFNKENLVAQLQILTVHSAASNTSQSLNVLNLTKYFKSLTIGQRDLMNQVCQITQLILVMPATNATSERSFCTLRRTKTYLRSTMKQERLNNFMILHIYSEQTDAINDNEIANEFVGRSEHRISISIFGKF